MNYLRLAIVAIAILFASCNAQKNVLYIQDTESGTEVSLPEEYLIRLKPLDQITVVVNSKNPELATPFNSSSSYSALVGTIANTATENNLQTFTIDQEGCITLPIIGKVECKGLTRIELAKDIENRIREAGYITDPQVNVRFANFTISVVGEVNKPGRFDIERDQISIFEALALAGDMTIYGKREDVAVIREQDGKNIITKIDLRSADCLTSPVYYLEQNDIVIVSPNKYKAATSEINQNRTFWISITSTAIALATLLLTILL